MPIVSAKKLLPFQTELFGSTSDLPEEHHYPGQTWQSLLGLTAAIMVVLERDQAFDRVLVYELVRAR